MLVKYNMMNIFELMEEARVNEEAKRVFIERWENCVVGIPGETALNGPLAIRIKFFNAVDDIQRRDDKSRLNALRTEARSSKGARTALEKLCSKSNVKVPVDDIIKMSTSIFDSTILPSMSI